MGYKLYIDKICDMCTAAREHVSGQNYLLNHGVDEVTDRIILQDIFSLLLDDLLTMGVEFHCTKDDLYSSEYELDLFLRFIENIMPTGLYTKSKEDSLYRDMLMREISGLGSEEYYTVTAILEFLVEVDPGKYTDSFNHLHDKMVSTPIFDGYVKYIVNVDDHITKKEDSDVNIILAYTGFIHDTKTRVLHLVDNLSRKIDGNIDIDHFYHLVDMYILNSCDKEYIDEYAAYFDGIKNPIRFEQNKDMFRRIETIYNSNNPFNIYYYTSRRILCKDFVFFSHELFLIPTKALYNFHFQELNSPSQC